MKQQPQLANEKNPSVPISLASTIITPSLVVLEISNVVDSVICNSPKKCTRLLCRGLRLHSSDQNIRRMNL